MGSPGRCKDPSSGIGALVLLVIASVAGQPLTARPIMAAGRVQFSVFRDGIGERDGTSSMLEARILESVDLEDFYIGDFITQGGQPVSFYVTYYGSEQVLAAG